MRLSSKDQQGIMAAVASVMGDLQWDLWLYGSRVSDTTRGGDIDLLLLCREGDVAFARSVKRKVLVEIMKRIGERRVDLKISVGEARLQSDFVRAVLGTALKLGSSAGSSPDFAAT